MTRDLLRRAWRWLTGTCARCGTMPRVARPGRLDVHAQTAFLHGWCRDCGKIHNHAVSYGLAKNHVSPPHGAADALGGWPGWTEEIDPESVRAKAPRK